MATVAKAEADGNGLVVVWEIGGDVFVGPFSGVFDRLRQVVTLP